jgi:hypothetical protein
MTNDDDVVRRALAGRSQPVDAHRALQELRPAMRRTRTNRRIAVVATAAVIVTGGGVAALTIADSPDAPRLRPVATVEAVIPAVSTTIVVTDPSGPADDASPVDPSSTSSSLPPATTELAEPPPPPSPPPPTEPRVVEPSSPPPVIAVPSSSVPAPEPAPAPEPVPTTTTSAAPSTTITSLCGQLVVTIESGRVFIASISALAGFDAIVGTDGPTSVEVEFKGEGGTCEIHAELEQGALDVEVQNPERDD